MSLLLLIDGYNLVQPLGPGRGGDPRWLQRDRNRLMSTLANHLPIEVRKKTCVVFDAANPPRNRPNQFSHEDIEIRFAVGYPTADDLIEELVRAHHTPKKLMVVSSDHRVQTAASRRNAEFSDSEPWMDDLTDDIVNLAAKAHGTRPRHHANQQRARTAPRGKKHRPNPAPPENELGTESTSGGAGQSRKPNVADAKEVEEWMRKFGFEQDL